MEIKNLAQQYIYWPEVENTYQKNINFSQVSASELKPMFEEELDSNSVSVENTIIRFYALNEILAKLRRQENELLDENALALYKKYMDEVENTSKKLFSYMFFITLQEARYCYDLNKINDVKSIIDNEDYYTVESYESRVRNSLDSIFTKNREKYYERKNALNEKLTDLEYEYDHPNYKQYKAELELIHAKYRKVSDRLETRISRLTDIFREELSQTKEERTEAIKDEKINEYLEKFINKEVMNEDITKEEMARYIDFSKKFAEIRGWSGHKDVIQLLDTDEFKDFKVDEILKCVVAIFTNGEFSSSYGGLPWANITSHALNFARGNINAEVFVDQAFSLEHNNGNMFNKNVIFNSCENMSWRSLRYDPKGYEKYDSQYLGINNGQFLLNAQHQGQLLSLLSLDNNAIADKLGHDTLAENVEQYKKSGLLNGDMTKSDVRRVDDCIYENLSNLKRICKNFHHQNSDFKKILQNFKVEIPNFDLLTIMNGCKKDRNDSIELDERHHLFNNLMTYQINKYTKKELVSTIKSVNFSFEYLNTKNVPEEKLQKELLGNKAYGLAQMHSMDLPVPEALVFPTTNAAGYFSQKAKWLNSLRPELNKIKDHFKDAEGNPIACSVRSGSSISMPGMMDTILNVGIDNTNYDYFCKKMGKEVTNECVTKFMSLFTKSLFNEEVKFSSTFSKALFQFRDVLNRNGVAQDYEGKFPLNARQQYKWCLEAVFKSWHSERANAYRNYQGIDHDIGTAAIVQQMVFGNLNDQSCTGVVFSRDCISGEKGIIGEFLPKAQGEDVVSGAVTPKNIKELKDFNPVIYDELLAICERLEKDTGDIQDIEFTVEDNKLYILQKRKAVCSSLAQTKLNQELFESGIISEEKMLSSINVDSLIAKEIVDTGRIKPELKGLVGNPGVMRGIIIHSEADMDKYKEVYEANKRDANFGWIFYAPETSPDHAPIMIKTQAFITSNGGFTSHAAILSRSWDKPCIVGVGEEKHALLESGSVVTLDANNGKIYKDILPLKEGSKKEIDALVTRILDFHKINLEELTNENPLNNAVLEVNKRKSWMEEHTTAVKVHEKPVSHNQFLALGHKLALMLVKSKEDSKKTPNTKIDIDYLNTSESKKKSEKEARITSEIDCYDNIIEKVRMVRVM